MHRSNLIQADSHTWLVLREFPQHPKAIIHLMTDTTGDNRYILMTWHPEASQRRMVGIHTSLGQAEEAVPWPSKTPAKPGLPPRPAPRETTEPSRTSGCPGA